MLIFNFTLVIIRILRVGRDLIKLLNLMSVAGEEKLEKGRGEGGGNEKGKEEGLSL